MIFKQLHRIVVSISVMLTIGCNSQDTTTSIDLDNILLTEDEKAHLENVVKKYEALTLEQIKDKTEAEYNKFKATVETQKEYIFPKDSTLKEKYRTPFKLYLKGIELQEDVLKNSTYFTQRFQHDSVRIAFDTEVNYITRHHSDYAIFSDTYTPLKKYYSTKDIDSVFNPEAVFSFDYYDINFGKSKYLDSICFKAHFRYTTKYDSIVFNKTNRLSQQGIKIVELTNNYVHFEKDNDLEYIQIEAYNRQGKSLEIKRKKYYAPGTFDTKLKSFRKDAKVFSKAMAKAKTHAEALHLIKTFNTKGILLERENTHQQLSFHGNIHQLVFYLETEHQERNFEFVAKNTNPQRYYLNELDSTTQVKDRNNTLLFTIPEINLKFTKNQLLDEYNLSYLAKEKDDGYWQYYYLNVEKQIFEPTNNVDVLSTNLVAIEKHPDEFSRAIFNNNFERLSDYVYDFFEVEIINNQRIIRAKKSDDTYTLINTSGQEIGPKNLSRLSAYYFEDYGIIEVKQNNLYGYIDANGTTVIPCLYDYITPFRNGRAIAIKPDKSYAVISTKHEVIIPWTKEEITYKIENRKGVYKIGRKTYNQNGNLLH